MVPARGAYGDDVGGTSFGSATGLSSGMFAAAIGGKTAGSIAKPSTLAGLYALEPSVGSISEIRVGNIGVSPDWEALGPMGKSAKDVALLMDVMASKADRGGGSYSEGLENARLDRKRRCRIAVHDPDRARRDSTDGDCRTRAFDAAVQRLGQHPQIELVPSLTSGPSPSIRLPGSRAACLSIRHFKRSSTSTLTTASLSSWRMLWDLKLVRSRSCCSGRKIIQYGRCPSRAC